MEFGFTRRVQENFIDLDQMSKDGRIDREVEGSPNGYYPVIVVPQYLIGKKVLIIPISEENIPLDLMSMVEDKTKHD
jgi:hypothetical protein